MQFPLCEITPNQDPEAHGIDVYHMTFLQDRLPSKEFCRVFVVIDLSRNHVFFVCPFRFTSEQAQRLVEAGQAFAKGYQRPQFHFIVEYAAPDDLADWFADADTQIGLEAVAGNVGPGELATIHIVTAKGQHVVSIRGKQE